MNALIPLTPEDTYSAAAARCLHGSRRVPSTSTYLSSESKMYARTISLVRQRGREQLFGGYRARWACKHSRLIPWNGQHGHAIMTHHQLALLDPDRTVESEDVREYFSGPSQLEEFSWRVLQGSLRTPRAPRLQGFGKSRDPPDIVFRPLFEMRWKNSSLLRPRRLVLDVRSVTTA